MVSEMPCLVFTKENQGSIRTARGRGGGTGAKLPAYKMSFQSVSLLCMISLCSPGT